jgi:drug/metabolite transporter (DMT)-like permease
MVPWQVRIAIAITVWGASFVATKTALREATPFAIVGLRFGIGIIILLATVFARREWRWVPRRDLAHFALLGCIGVLVHQGLQANGLRTTSATNTGWMVALIPVFTALLARVLLGERLTPVRLLGIALAFTGALVVIGRGRLDFGIFRLPSAFGDLLVFLSAPNWAVFSVLSKPVLRRYPAALVMSYVLLLGWLFVLPIAVHQHMWEQAMHLSATGWTAILFLGIFCSGFAYVFWYDGLRAADASQVAAFLYAEPLVTVMVAAAVLGEAITPATLVGGAVILAGVWLVNRPARRTAAVVTASGTGS